MNLTLEQHYIKLLYDYGHFYNPEYPNNLNIKLEDLAKLSFKDKVVIDAFTSFQYMMNVDLTRLGDKHELNLNVFDIPRCGQPDYEDPKLLSKIGSGSWPEPCQKAGILVHINKARLPNVLKDKWADIQAQSFAAYHKIGANLIETDDINKAHIRVWWEVLMGSTIGLAQYNSQRCTGWVFCKLDPGYTGLMFELFTHELGHNCNLNHTRGGIMNPSVIAVNPKEWAPSDPSYKILVKYFGGDPVTPQPPPNPDDSLPQTKVDFTNHKSFKSINIDFPNNELIVEHVSGRIRKLIIVDNSLI